MKWGLDAPRIRVDPPRDGFNRMRPPLGPLTLQPQTFDARVRYVREIPIPIIRPALGPTAGIGQYRSLMEALVNDRS